MLKHLIHSRHGQVCTPLKKGAKQVESYFKEALWDTETTETNSSSVSKAQNRNQQEPMIRTRPKRIGSGPRNFLNNTQQLLRVECCM